MSTTIKRVAIRRVHSWIRHIMLQQMQNHQPNHVNHDGIITGMPLMRSRLVIGPVLQYMPGPRTRDKIAGELKYDLTNH